MGLGFEIMYINSPFWLLPWNKGTRRMSLAIWHRTYSS